MGLTLTDQGVTKLAAANAKDFKGLAFCRVWNPFSHWMKSIVFLPSEKPVNTRVVAMARMLSHLTIQLQPKYAHGGNLACQV